MNEPTNSFGSLAREGRLAATLTDLGRNMLDEDETTINREHLAHKFVCCDLATRRNGFRLLLVRRCWSCGGCDTGGGAS